MARIAFGGSLGAGKTKVCERLAPTLGYRYFYAGGIIKDKAKKAGMPVEEYYASISDKPEIDLEIDRTQEQLFRENENVVMEGRISAFLAPEIPKIKVFLKVDPEEGARRQQNREENKGRSIAQIVMRTDMRIDTERARYAHLYPWIGDHMDERRFDIVIDTTNLSEEEAFQRVLYDVRQKIKPP